MRLPHAQESKLPRILRSSDYFSKRQQQYREDLLTVRPLIRKNRRKGKSIPLPILQSNERRRENWLDSLTKDQREQLGEKEFMRKYMSFGMVAIR